MLDRSTTGLKRREFSVIIGRSIGIAGGANSIEDRTTISALRMSSRGCAGQNDIDDIS